MKLAEWRRKIDKIDRKLVELLNARSNCVVEIGRLKKMDGMALFQPERERQVLEDAEKANRGPLSEAAIRRLFGHILDEARSVEQTVMHDGAAIPRHKTASEPKSRPAAKPRTRPSANERPRGR